MQIATPKSKTGSLKRLLSVLGPGLITGASDDDPSGIATYSVAGARFGYAPLWTAVVTFPLMTGVQYICAKIGLASGSGIGRVLRKHYSKKLLYAVIAGLFLANTINTGADILAIAAGMNLLVPVPLNWAIGPIALLVVVVQIWGSYRVISKIFKWLTLSLFAYVGASLLARPDWHKVIEGTLVPTVEFNADYIAMLVAILGTTISPYLFFWQASSEVEEERAQGRNSIKKRKGASSDDLTDAALDVGAGMFFSNLVMYFIILATAASLHGTENADVNSAADAAEALRPLAGDAATILMALGLIGTGFLAIPVLTASAGYAICEAFEWNCTLNAKPHRAKEFYIVIGAATLGGLLMDFAGVNPIDALFWTAVLNGLLAPPLLVVIMLIANNKKVMKEHVNGFGLNLLGWTTAALITAAAAGLLLTWSS